MRIVLLIFALAAVSAHGTVSADTACDANYLDYAVVYVAIDGIYGNGALASAWAYVETNGEPGLQRGGDGLLDLTADVCQATVNHDTLIGGAFFPESGP